MPDRNQRKALGKGLSALLPSRTPPTPVAAAATTETSPQPIAPKPPLPEEFENFQSLPLDQILPGNEQPRRKFDEQSLRELADSIRANGLIQPITVYREGESRYRIIAGERRWRAARIAGLSEIAALVRPLEQLRILELGLIENIQREDLNPVEIASAFDRLVKDHGLSHEQIAERTGKERSTVTNYIRLLKLSAFVRSRLAEGKIAMGHARALLNLGTDAEQNELCEAVEGRQLSVRQTEQTVRDWLRSDSKNRPPLSNPEPKTDPNVRAAVDEMSAALGTKVRLIAKSDESGRLEIEYYSQEDLDRIYSVITGQ